MGSRQQCRTMAACCPHRCLLPTACCLPPAACCPFPFSKSLISMSIILPPVDRVELISGVKAKKLKLRQI